MGYANVLNVYVREYITFEYEKLLTKKLPPDFVNIIVVNMVLSFEPHRSQHCYREN